MSLQTGPRWWEPLGQKTGPRCTSTSIRRDISSPSTSDNEPRIAYIWMYVSWDRYRDTYLDIWVRRVIIIIIGSVIAIVMIIVLAIVPVMTHVTLWLLPLLVEIPVTIPDCWLMSSSVWFMSFLFGIHVMIIAWFAILILYAWDCGSMRQGYIYEGFLVWIIPSTY